MPDLLTLARALIQDQPEKAHSAWEFVVRIREANGEPAKQAEIDAVEEFLYSQTESCAQHRKEERRAMLG